MTLRGYAEWSAEHGIGPMHFAGIRLEHPCLPPRFARSPNGVALRAYDASTITQEMAIYRDAPVGRVAWTGEIALTLGSDADAWAIESAASRQDPIKIYLGAWYVVDRWPVAIGGAGRTLWRTSRRGPWEVPGMDTFASPPVFEVRYDGVAATPVASSPGPGEVMIPASNDGSGGWNASIETPDLSALGVGSIEARYAPEWVVRVIAFGKDPSTWNAMALRLTVEECLPAGFEAPL